MFEAIVNGIGWLCLVSWAAIFLLVVVVGSIVFLLIAFYYVYRRLRDFYKGL